MTFDEFLAAAWAQHGDEPQTVADRVANSLHLVNAPEHIPPFARLLTHVYGEHLGQWDNGVSLLESLRNLPAFDGSPPVVGALTRNVAALRFASGDGSALYALGAEDQVCAMATATAAFAGRMAFAQALGTYSQALRLAEEGLPAGTPAIRALAVGGNNLAAALEVKTNRDSAETQGMITAAEGALKYWKQAGTWLEEERAEYRLARSLLQAGDAHAAVRTAQRCVAVCTANNAPPFEQFFGHAVLALAHRAARDAASFEAARTRATSLFEQVPTEERQWCEQALHELHS